MSSFDIISGTSKTLECPIVDQDGAAVDLSAAGTVITLDVGRDLDQPSARLILSTAMSLKSGSTNIARIAFVPAETSALPYGRYRAEVKVAFQDGSVLKTEQPFDFVIKRGVRQ